MTYQPPESMDGLIHAFTEAALRAMQEILAQKRLTTIALQEPTFSKLQAAMKEQTVKYFDEARAECKNALHMGEPMLRAIMNSNATLAAIEAIKSVGLIEVSVMKLGTPPEAMVGPFSGN